MGLFFFFFSSRRRHTRSLRDWSSDVCSSDLEAGAKVELSVQPFFWETRWFYALIALGAGLGGFGAFRLRVRQLREHKRELEALVAVRTRDLVAEKERSEAARGEAERQNEFAQEADRQQGELLSIAAHDLETTLQPI